MAAASGTYITRSDIEDTFGATTVHRWTDLDRDGDSASIESRIQRAIDYAERVVDARFRGSRYSVPLTATSGTAYLVKDWSAVLAGVWLYRLRGQDDSDRAGEENTRYTEMVDRVHNEISSVVNGSWEAALQLTDSGSPTAPAGLGIPGQIAVLDRERPGPA